MTKELIHICPDEKFIDCAIAQFELLDSVKSAFFILHKKGTGFVKKRASNIFFFDTPQKLLKKLKNEYPNAIVVLHSICIAPRYLKRLGNRLILCFWGWELYSDVHSPLKRLIQMDLYRPITRRLLEDNKKWTLKFKEFVKKIFHVNYWREKDYNDLLKKCEAFSTVYPIEFSMINLDKKKFYPFKYIRPSETNESAFKAKVVQSEHPRVLVGNSLAPTNNHIDILKKLNDYGKYIEVVLPISYDGDYQYKTILKKYISGLKFIKPIYLEKFLARNEYFNLISSCSALIFGHMRQQGAGNIDQGFKDGFDIYMYEDSINYKHFVEKGYVVHSIEKDLLNIFYGKGLSLSEQQQNYRKYLMAHDYEKYQKNLIDFFETF